MLRISQIGEERSITLKLEGKLVGPWVEELEKVWHSIEESGRDHILIVDLNDLSLIDRTGEQLLKRMHVEGITLIAESPYAKQRLQKITAE